MSARKKYFKFLEAHASFIRRMTILVFVNVRSTSKKLKKEACVPQTLKSFFLSDIATLVTNYRNMIFMEECVVCSLSAGAQTAGIVSLVEAALFVAAAFLLEDCPMGGIDQEMGEARAQVIFIFQIVSIVVAALALLFTLLLFIGIAKRRSELLLPWITLNCLAPPLVIAAALLLAILAIINAAYLLATAIILAGVCFSFLPIFLVYVVLSIHHEYKTVKFIR